MYLMKTDAATGKGLEGFEFTVTGPGRNTFTVVTGRDGKAEFTMPPDGTYIYRETSGQSGYLISEETYRFTIFMEELPEQYHSGGRPAALPETPRLMIPTALEE